MNFLRAASIATCALVLLAAISDVTRGQQVTPPSTMATTSNYIQCFSCQPNTPGCNDPFGGPIIQCSSNYGCLKQVGSTSGGAKTVSRQCAQSQVQNIQGAGCIGGSIGQLYETTCVCYTNLCNSGRQLRSDVTHSVALLLLVVMTTVLASIYH